MSVNEIYSLRSAAALLGWDQETMMPPRGGEGRALAFSAISKVIQEKYCMESNGELISYLELPEEKKKLNEWQQGLLREFKKDRDRYLKIPLSLTEEMAKTSSLTQQIWVQARPKNDTSAFNPILKGLGSQNKTLKAINNSNHIITLDNDKEFIESEVAGWLKSTLV